MSELYSGREFYPFTESPVETLGNYVTEILVEVEDNIIVGEN